MANDVTKLITTLRASGVLDDPSLRKGIARYSALQRDLQTTSDVTQAPDFQRLRAFYRVRRVAARLFRVHATAPEVRAGLPAIAARSRGSNTHCEASFASKLAATLNPDLPVLDALVLAVMRAHLPGEWTLLRTSTLDSRLVRAVEVYDCLTDAVRRIIAIDAGAELLKLFDRQYAQHAFANTKKTRLHVMALRRDDVASAAAVAGRPHTRRARRTAANIAKLPELLGR